MIFFLICSGIGLTFLMISLFTGNDGDISSADVDIDSSGVFSLRTIMAFLTTLLHEVRPLHRHECILRHCYIYQFGFLYR